MEYPKVIVKKKSIQTLLDYCLEQSIDFSVRQKPFSDNEMEVEVKLADVKKALVMGMFLRENRFDVDGMSSESATAQPKVIKKDKVAPVKKSKSDDLTEDISTNGEAAVEEGSDLFKA